MRRFVITLVLGLTACATAPSAPSTTLSSDRTELAQQYAELVAVPGVLEALYTAYIDEYRARLPAYADNCVYDPQPADCRRIIAAAVVDINLMLDDALQAALTYKDDLIAADAKTYANLYTVEELQANIAFYQSTVGRSILAKSPALAKGLTENQYSVFRPWQDQLDASITAIFLHHGYAIEEPEPDAI